jgi:hypothetical protein
MTNGSPMSGPIVPSAREGHRRQFSEAEKRRIVEEAVQPRASLSEVARRYGDSGACPVPLEAGADAGGTAVNGGRDCGCLTHRGVRIVTLLPRGVKVHLAFGFIDMRKGIHGLAMLVQEAAAGSLFGPPLRVPGPESPPHQDCVLGWHRTLPFHQADLTRRVPLTVERRTGWDADADLGAVVDAD